MCILNSIDQINFEPQNTYYRVCNNFEVFKKEIFAKFDEIWFANNQMSSRVYKHRNLGISKEIYLIVL